MSRARPREVGDVSVSSSREMSYRLARVFAAVNSRGAALHTEYCVMCLAEQNASKQTSFVFVGGDCDCSKEVKR